MIVPTEADVLERFKEVREVIVRIGGPDNIVEVQHKVNVDKHGVVYLPVTNLIVEDTTGVVLWSPEHGYSTIVRIKNPRPQPPKIYKYCLDLAIDFKFWSTGCINLNFHNGFTLEVEFLCFGLYAGRVVDEKSQI